jgi:hypothetical protein
VSTPLGNQAQGRRYSDELLQALHVAVTALENLLQTFGYDIFAQGFYQGKARAPVDGATATIPDTDTRNAQAAIVQMNAGAPAATSLTL